MARGCAFAGRLPAKQKAIANQDGIRVVFTVLAMAGVMVSIPVISLDFTFPYVLSTRKPPNKACCLLSLSKA